MNGEAQAVPLEIEAPTRTRSPELATIAVLWKRDLKRVLRQTGIAILERIFGLILAAIAVQFVFDGGKELLAR